MRLRLDIAYDGTAFSGWAAQPGLRTVQGELEKWIARILRLDAPLALTVAGRTDAGVHARGQVAHVDLPDDLDPTTLTGRGAPDDVAPLLHRRLARALPDDLAVRAVTAAPHGFDARFSAIWRRYAYRIADTATPTDPLARHTTTTLRTRLDVAAMNAVAPTLLGLRDFASFCKARDGATTIRTLQHLHTSRGPDGVITVDLRADAFCHSMVRALVGALTVVGGHHQDVTWLADRLAARTRASDIPVLSAHGLVLEEVGYPPPEALAARAAESRRVRDASEVTDPSAPRPYVGHS